MLCLKRLLLEAECAAYKQRTVFCIRFQKQIKLYRAFAPILQQIYYNNFGVFCPLLLKTPGFIKGPGLPFVLNLFNHFFDDFVGGRFLFACFKCLFEQCRAVL